MLTSRDAVVGVDFFLLSPSRRCYAAFAYDAFRLLIFRRLRYHADATELH